MSDDPFTYCPTCDGRLPPHLARIANALCKSIYCNVMCYIRPKRMLLKLVRPVRRTVAEGFANEYYAQVWANKFAFARKYSNLRPLEVVQEDNGTYSVVNPGMHWKVVSGR